MSKENQLSEKDYHEMLAEQTPDGIIERNLYTSYLQASQNRVIKESIISQQMMKDITQNGLDDIDKIYEREFKLLDYSHKLQKASIENLAESLEHSRKTLKKNEQKDS